MVNFRKMITGFYLSLLKLRTSGAFKSEWKRDKLIVPFRMLIHPVDTLSDMKFEGRASFMLGNILMAIYVFQQTLIESSTSWIFGGNYEGVNFWMLLARTAGLIVLWTICNWAMCTLTEGEGKVKEIWTVMCYALLPMLIFGFIQLFFSYALSLDESIIYNFFGLFGTAWSLVLFFLGMMVAHQYTVAKTIASVFLTFGCMLVALFLLLLFFSISQQLVSFITTIQQELSF